MAEGDCHKHCPEDRQSHGRGWLSQTLSRGEAEGSCHKHCPELLFQHVLQDGSAEAPPPGRDLHSVALSTVVA